MKFDLVLRKLWMIWLVQEIREPNHADHVIGHRASGPLSKLLQLYPLGSLPTYIIKKAHKGKISLLLYIMPSALSLITLKAPRKNASEKVVCWSCLLQIFTLHYWLSMEANNVDPEQSAPIGAVWSGPTLFAIEAS